MPEATARGSFQVDERGAVIANDANVDALRNLWSSRPAGMPVGPGVSDTGAWHVACHLLAAGCVRRTSGGELLWLEISHVPTNDTYAATVTHGAAGEATTVPLSTSEAHQLLQDSSLVGFVEGTSEGHITARGVQDPPGRFGPWARQNYDRPAGDPGQGGRVWEHWCTTRDLAPDSQFSRALLTAYLQLCNAAGDLFAPTVARGRVDYGPPEQLNAMIDAGFTTQASASWATTPRQVEAEAELLLEEATAKDALQAIQRLSWADEPIYFMYARRISQWAG
jgi:hypothetical protein